MKKTFTGEEFYNLLRSYDYAFVCRDFKDFNGVYLRFTTSRLIYNKVRAGAQIEAQLGNGEWEEGGCTFVGKEFQCDFELMSPNEAIFNVTSDRCKEKFTICLRKNI